MFQRTHHIATIIGLGLLLALGIPANSADAAGPHPNLVGSSNSAELDRLLPELTSRLDSPLDATTLAQYSPRIATLLQSQDLAQMAQLEPLLRPDPAQTTRITQQLQRHLGQAQKIGELGYIYDANGRPSALNLLGRHYTFNYNQAGELLSLEENGQVELDIFYRDHRPVALLSGSGELIEVHYRGNAISYLTNAAGKRLTAPEQPPEATTVTYTRLLADIGVNLAIGEGMRFGLPSEDGNGKVRYLGASVGVGFSLFVDLIAILEADFCNAFGISFYALTTVFLGNSRNDYGFSQYFGLMLSSNGVLDGFMMSNGVCLDQALIPSVSLDISLNYSSINLTFSKNDTNAENEINFTRTMPLLALMPGDLSYNVCQ
jgi:hypothetical protein